MGKGAVVYRGPGMRLIVHRPDLHDPVATPAATAATPSAVKIGNLRRALRRWQQSGFKLTPSSERKTRSSICAACPHWDDAGNLGLGECRAPGCGCTRAKVWLATERCPLGKWAKSS